MMKGLPLSRGRQRCPGPDDEPAALNGRAADTSCSPWPPGRDRFRAVDTAAPAQRLFKWLPGERPGAMAGSIPRAAQLERPAVPARRLTGRQVRPAAGLAQGRSPAGSLDDHQPGLITCSREGICGVERELDQILKWNVLWKSRYSHQPKVCVPPSILANPRRPGWSVSLGFSIGMITSYCAV